MVVKKSFERAGEPKRRKCILALGIVFAAGLLCYFKYTNFILQTLRLPKVSVLPAPVGVSFLTFLLISYLADVYRGRIPAETRFSRFFLYALYFPKAAQGPLCRYGDFSAQLDGCGNIRYMFSILLPLSGPILAVIGLFYAVGIWNAYFDAMVYVSTRRSYYPLSLFLREILILNTTDIDQLDISTLMALEERRNVMKYAVIVVSSLPVMIIYPFVQRFFVKGVMIGAVKG